jgi:very-short-patch-repair endonuclease
MEDRHLKQPEHLVQNARKLRRRMSLPEVLLWKELKRSSGGVVKIKRQVPLLGKFIVDFYYQTKHIVFEIDGSVHRLRNEEDADRDAQLADNGYQVIRIPARNVLENPFEVAEFIRLKCLEGDDDRIV